MLSHVAPPICTRLNKARHSTSTTMDNRMEIIIEYNEKEMLTMDESSSSGSARSYDDFESESQTISCPSCAAGQQFKSCLKVKTQLDAVAETAPSSESPEIPERTPERKLVKFALVEIREYVRLLSDHPSTSSGAPIGIGWNYDPKDTTILDLNLYERSREGIRRTKRQLIIPREVRESMLREVSYSSKQIIEAARKVRKDKERRIVTFHQQKFDGLLEKVEFFKNVVRPLNCGRRSTLDNFPFQ
ncbi:hypothetical protein ACHAXA_007008 [Cyclostephanos tholiformis]|uniref:Uncharacterized protein n=1 Tax=Cyclostephanos tholiformis TaxID=382380 RepID=A0ABD3R9B6_9STRA